MCTCAGHISHSPCSLRPLLYVTLRFTFTFHLALIHDQNRTTVKSKMSLAFWITLFVCLGMMQVDTMNALRPNYHSKLAQLMVSQVHNLWRIHFLLLVFSILASRTRHRKLVRACALHCLKQEWRPPSGCADRV